MSILYAPMPAPVLPEPAWTPAPLVPTLTVDQLHIWRLRMASPVLDADECPVARHRAGALTPELFRKDVISRYSFAAGVTPGPVTALSVSAADCDHVALVAVSRAVRNVGLDLERVQQDIPFDEMAGDFLDYSSQWDLRVTRSLQEKAWKFYQFWTSNEACAKARHTSRIPSEISPFSPEPDFIAALAVRGGPAPHIRYWDWQC